MTFILWDPLNNNQRSYKFNCRFICWVRVCGCVCVCMCHSSILCLERHKTANFIELLFDIVHCAFHRATSVTNSDTNWKKKKKNQQFCFNNSEEWENEAGQNSFLIAERWKRICTPLYKWSHRIDSPSWSVRRKKRLCASPTLARKQKKKFQKLGKQIELTRRKYPGTVVLVPATHKSSLQ